MDHDTTYRPITPQDIPAMCRTNYLAYMRGKNVHGEIDEEKYQVFVTRKTKWLQDYVFSFDSTFKGLIAIDGNGDAIGHMVWKEWQDNAVEGTEIVELFQLPGKKYTGKHLLQEFVENLGPAQNLIDMLVAPDNVDGYKRLGFEMSEPPEGADTEKYAFMHTTQDNLRKISQRLEF